jgi:hypothetical protein
MHDTLGNRRRQEPPVAPPLARPRRATNMNRRLIGVILLLLLLLLGSLLIRQFRKPQPVVGPVAAVDSAAPVAPAATVRDTAPAPSARVHGARVTELTPPVRQGVSDRPPSAPTAHTTNVPKADLVRRMRPEKRPPRKVVPGIRMGTNQPNPLATLRSTSERVMSQLLSTRPGDRALEIGLGRNLDADFAVALTNIIEIYETDSEEEAAHKEAIGWMKETMREMVAQGESPEAILAAYREQLNELANYRDGLQRQLNALRRADKMEEAATFVEEANKILAEYGARPLMLPRPQGRANRPR